jgi:hypothetical protein
LGEKNLFNAQRNELIQRFDLNKESWLAEEIVKQFNQLMDEDEEQDGMTRLKPGELLVSVKGQRVVISLLTPEVISVLKRTGSFAEAKALVEKQALLAFRQARLRVSREELSALLSPRDLLPHPGDGEHKKAQLPRYLSGPLAPPQLVNAGRPDRIKEEDVLVPEKVVEKMLSFLAREGISHARGMAMIFRLAYLRELYYPLLDRAKPG